MRAAALRTFALAILMICGLGVLAGVADAAKCQADFDHNGRVDAVGLTVIAEASGESEGGPECPGDLDDDGDVDGADLAQFLASFERTDYLGVALSADPSHILFGESTTLAWTSRNAVSCSLAPGVGAVAASGSLTVTPSVDTTYTLTAVGSDDSAAASVTLSVDTSTTALQGTIVDDATVLGLSRVRVTASDGQNSWTTTTGAAGNFMLVGVNPGTLTITISKEGYQTQRRTEEASGGKMVSIFTALPISTIAFNDSDNPSTATRTGRFQANDGAAADNLSDIVTRNIAPSAVNDGAAANSLSNIATRNLTLNTTWTFVGGSISASTARDGQTLTLTYQIDSSVSEPVVLQTTLIGPGGETITDHYRDKSVQLVPGTQSYTRDVFVNLPPNGQTGLYSVIWTVHSVTGGDQSVRQDGALTVNAPVSIRVPIIMYHNVAPVPQDVDWTTPDQLRAHIVALQAYGYTPITYSELMNYRAGIGTPPAKPVMLTFDDGYGNFYIQAFPVLFALNAKSTVFIITQDADNNPNAMNWTQLQELNGKLNAAGERLVDVEGHTVTHPDLTTLNPATLQTQLVNSKQNLESHLGKEIRLISYPFGYTNLTVKQAAWQAGYAGGVLAWGGTELTSANKWELKRVGGLTTTSVIYNPSQPGEFLFTKIADPTVVVPLITINSIQYLDAAGNALPSNTIVAGQTVRVRVTATNTGPATSGLVSLKLDNDSNHNNGVVYDSRLSGGDLVWNFASGTQTFDFNWAVPTSATTGQYYADVTFDDQYHVLYFKDSGWQTAFIVSASGQTAPTITTQPQSQTVKEGTAVTFSVVASGRAPLSYQWQRNGANIAGATSASYTLSSPTVADSGAQFRVVVTNTVGSVTSSAATLTVTGTGTGLQGQYFDNSNFTNLKLTRTDATVNFNWGTGSPHSSIGANTFSVRWTGKVQPQYSETYTFYVTHNDGARLWVNNQLIVNNWTNRSSSATTSGSITLVAGQKYNIQLDYYENTGSAVAQLAWSSPRVTRQIIPAAQLYLPASQAAAPP